MQAFMYYDPVQKNCNSNNYIENRLMLVIDIRLSLICSSLNLIHTD